MKICKNECGACLFGPNPLLDHVGRAEKIRRVVKADSYFICHEATARGAEVMCRGWWDELRWATNPGRIAERLGMQPDWVPRGAATNREYQETIATAKKGRR